MALTVNDASLEDLARASLQSVDDDDADADAGFDTASRARGLAIPAAILPQTKSTTSSSIFSNGGGPPLLSPAASLSLTERLGRKKNDDFERKKRHLIARGKLYEDPYFPANGNSMYYSKATPRGIVWRRPTEISRNPKFITGSIVRFDVDQHGLGDCWYLAALATVATRPALLETVVPLDQSFDAGDYAGIFQFNFWRFGRWEQVIVDDRLPFDTSTKRLYFCHNRDQPDEFWSALCEKAFAKCFGSYEALVGGLPQDALVDLTGAVGEMIYLKDKLPNPDLLWKQMLTSNDQEFGALLTAGIFAPAGSTSERETELASGLYARHAYSITAAKVVSLEAGNADKVRLVRVRNPWGDYNEWKGEWSDRSWAWSRVSKETRESLDLRIAHDGEFWLAFDEFVKHFDAIMIGHLTPDTLAPIMFNKNRRNILNRDKFEWSETMFNGSWVRGVSAGGRNRLHLNPQFRVELTPPPNFGRHNEIPLVVSLLQINRRLMRTITGDDETNLPINFFVFKPKRSVTRKRSYRFDELEYVDGGDNYRFDREIAKTFFLPPGDYVVIPSIYYADREGEFLVRFMTLGPAQVEPNEDDTDPIEPAVVSETELLDQLYDKHSGGDRFLDAFELSEILKEMVEGVLHVAHGFSVSTCIAILDCFDLTRDRRLNRFELKECWESIKTYHDIFTQFDLNQDGLFDASELPKAYQKLKLNVSRRMIGVLVRLYGTKRGYVGFEGFILSITTLLSYSRKWRKNKDYVFGKIDFEQYLLWELNDEIPHVSCIDGCDGGDQPDNSSDESCAIL